jgi:chromate transporter
MMLLRLFAVFFKIGLFSFGGGYAMIPLIQKEIERNGWMTSAEFIDIIAIAEMTPGPIAVNSATFVGYKTAGILGGIFATTGVAAPSALLILLVADFILKHKDHPLKVSVFSTLRPVVAALVLSAAFFVAETSLLTLPSGGFDLSAFLSAPLRFIDLKSVGILAFTFVSALLLKLHPILTIVLAGAAGVLLYGFLPLR